MSARTYALSVVPPPVNNWRLDALRKVLRTAVARIELQGDTVKTRKMIARLARLAPPSMGVRRSDTKIHGIDCRFFEPKDATQGPLIIHLHGGGFSMGSVRHTHDLFCSDYARSTKLAVVGVDYRKAPEHPFPGPIEDCLNVYLTLVERGRDPKQLVISGDSAGGNLALAVCQRLRERNLPMPGALVLMSPWVDLEMRGQTLGTNEHADYITRAVLRTFISAYLGDQDPRHPLASPCHAEFGGFPSMFVQVGGDEAMLSEVRWMVCKAQSHGVDARIQEWRGMVHAFQGFSAFLPESVEAMRAVRSYLAEKYPEMDAGPLETRRTGVFRRGA